MYQLLLRRLGPVPGLLRSPLQPSLIPGRASSLRVFEHAQTPFTPAKQHVRSAGTQSRAALGLWPFRRRTVSRKPRRLFRKLLFLLGGLTVAGYAADRFYLGSVISRSVRAYGTMALVGLDYKLHIGTNPWIPGVQMEELHARNARRVCDMLKRNGGLYLKAGQAVAMQGNVLPERYQRKFSEMFDDATHSPWSDIEAVVREEFGQSIDQVFGNGLEREPRASASIAQVHYAQLPGGREVAVKVQRRKIGTQVSWDLRTLKRMIEFTAEATSIPMETLGGFVMDHVMQEIDFERERCNSERLAEFIRSDPRLCDSVYIPKVYGELSSKRVLTTEWIHGLNLWDKDDITGHYAPTTGAPTGGLGLRLSDVMEIVIELFSAQMFRYGFVHCDPHPGNIFVRRMPSGKPQVVLLDHGLYITLSDDLRQQYARFWKGLLLQDNESLKEVSTAWGMSNPEPWADAFLMNSKKLDKSRVEETQEELEERMIAEAAGYFGEDGLWPRELVFLERNLGLVQGNNRFLGSPVNRVKLIGLAAMRALEAERQDTLWQTLKSRWVLFMLDVAFYFSRARQYLGYGGGFEEDLKEEEDKAARELKDTIAVVFGIAVD